MTDYGKLVPETAASDANGRDPLETAGVAALRSGCDLGDVEIALRQLVPLLPVDPLERRVLRGRAITALKAAKVQDATGLVDAALPPTARNDPAQGQAVAFGDPDAWTEPVDGAQLLERVLAFLLRFLGLPRGADALLAAFVVYTWAAEAFAAATYIVAHSPAPQCGKTRLLECLALLVRRSWLTIVPSTAVLFRVLEQHAPTLLLDEAEVVRGRGDSADDLKALLQSGYRRGAFVPRCVGDANEVRNFRVFGPKVFALIGELPAALFDRCIRVEMARRLRTAGLERFRPDRLEREALTLRRQARRWAADHRSELEAVTVPVLEVLDERAEEVWGPLFAVGLVAGGGWYPRLVEAAGILSGGRSTTSLGVELLTDIRKVFDARKLEPLPSAELAVELNALEGRRWADWNRGKGITANAIARLLRDFHVKPQQMWTNGVKVRGYRSEDFARVFGSYLPEKDRDDDDEDSPGGGTPLTTGRPVEARKVNDLQTSQPVDASRGLPVTTGRTKQPPTGCDAGQVVAPHRFYRPTGCEGGAGQEDVAPPEDAGDAWEPPE